MKRRGFVLGAAMAALAIGCGRGADASGRARQMVAEGATLLDVRSAGEWNAGHLDGAVHIPVAELAQRMRELPEERAVVVYCASGVRSAQAARMLTSEGYEVFDLGSMRAWDAR